MMSASETVLLEQRSLDHGFPTVAGTLAHFALSIPASFTQREVPRPLHLEIPLP